MFQRCRHLPASYTKISFTFIVNYLFLHVLVIFWRKLSEDGDNAETCRSYVMERTHRLLNCALVGVSRVLIDRILK